MAALVGAAVIAAAGAAYSASEQKKATNSANAANMASQQQAQQQLKYFGGKAEGAANKGVKAAERGFDDAQKAVGIIGQAGRKRIERRETARMGDSDAQAANRGLYSSTRALNARSQIGAETDLTLAGIDEAVAGLHSQIFRDRARTIGQFHQAKMSMYAQFAGMGSGVAMANQHQAANIGGGIGAAAGGLAQMLMAYDARPDAWGGQSSTPGAWFKSDGTGRDLVLP